MNALPVPVPAVGHRRRFGVALRLRIVATQAVTGLEQLWSQFWLPLAATFLFAGVGFLGAADWLWPWLRLALLGGLGAAWLVALWRRGGTLIARQRPAMARLEAVNGLRRGTLEALADAPASSPQPVTDALWQQAQQQLRSQAGPTDQLKWVRPSLGPWRTPRSLSLGATLLACAVAAGFAGQDAGTRLSRMASPWLQPLDGISISAFVTTPQYMNQSPRRVDIVPGTRTALMATAGSVLDVTIGGIDGPVRLITPQSIVDTRPASGLASVRARLLPGRYHLRLGPLRPVAQFDVTLTPDGAPIIAFAKPPTVSRTQTLEISYQGSDDFGIARLYLAVMRGGIATATELAAPPPGTQITGSSFADLTPHRFAGDAVTLKLVAYDAQGNVGVSPPLNMRLPAKRFTQPAAQRIIAVRKRIWQTPDALPQRAEEVHEISRHPGDLDNNLTAFTALRAVVWRLRSPLAWTEIDSSTALLWDVALDLEAARVGKDMAALRQKFEALLQKMKDGKAGQKDMDALMAEMARYMASKAASAPPPTGPQRTLSADVLQQLMEQARERMAAGDTQGARKALEALQAIMENASFGPPGGAGSGAAGPMDQALNAAIKRQQDLMTQTRAAGAAAGSGPNGGTPSDDLDAIGQAQGTLATAVARAGEAAPPKTAKALSGALSAAAKAMQEAAENLKRGDAPAAAQAQARALAQLASARAANRASAENAQESGALAPGSDPLGRQGNTNGANGPEARLPSAADRQQVQAIRKLLEERAADPNRSENERAYILRLLQQF